jgi:hypothetical protein
MVKTIGVETASNIVSVGLEYKTMSKKNNTIQIIIKF